jgi:hypothetical protein
MPSPLCERTCISVRESYRARFRTKSSMHRGGRLSRKCNITTKCNISYKTKHIKVIINICLLVTSYGVQHIHPATKVRRGCHKEILFLCYPTRQSILSIQTSPYLLSFFWFFSRAYQDNLDIAKLLTWATLEAIFWINSAQVKLLDFFPMYD